MMDLSIFVNKMSSEAAQLSQQVQSKITAADLNNPDRMLQAQFAIQQYSNFVGYESAVIKTIKDLLQGIIAKI